MFLQGVKLFSKWHNDDDSLFTEFFVDFWNAVVHFMPQRSNECDEVKPKFSMW